MTSVIVKTSTTDNFFDNARNAAYRIDNKIRLKKTITYSFEDPQEMFRVLSEARRRLMIEIMEQPMTINQLSIKLHRDRTAISKDISVLEKVGLVISHKRSNPGHGIEKVVRSIAPKIELMATLG